MIFPTAGDCLSVHYHSPDLVPSGGHVTKNQDQLRQKLGGHWPLANHLQCSKPGWIMPSLWYTLMHTSTDKLFNLLLMTSSEKCPQGRVYFYKSENSGYLIIGWTRLSQSSCEFTFCPQLPLPTGAFQLSTTSLRFSISLTSTTAATTSTHTSS